MTRATDNSATELTIEKARSVIDNIFDTPAGRQVEDAIRASFALYGDFHRDIDPRGHCVAQAMHDRFRKFFDPLVEKPEAETQKQLLAADPTDWKHCQEFAQALRRSLDNTRTTQKIKDGELLEVRSTTSNLMNRLYEEWKLPGVEFPRANQLDEFWKRSIAYVQGERIDGEVSSDKMSVVLRYPVDWNAERPQGRLSNETYRQYLVTMLLTVLSLSPTKQTVDITALSINAHLTAEWDKGVSYAPPTVNNLLRGLSDKRIKSALLSHGIVVYIAEDEDNEECTSIRFCYEDSDEEDDDEVEDLDIARPDNCTHRAEFVRVLTNTVLGSDKSIKVPFHEIVHILNVNWCEYNTNAEAPLSKDAIFEFVMNRTVQLDFKAHGLSVSWHSDTENSRMSLLFDREKKTEARNKTRKKTKRN